MSKKFFYLFFIFLFFISYFISIDYSMNNLSSKYFWPTENFTNITSYFGYRIHPTTFQVSYHSGIDIAAPENTSIRSICNGTVVYTGFNGAYGYSIIIKNENVEILYGHVSPEFIISVGDFIMQNTIIGKVGPKYVDNSIYFDSNRTFY